MHFTATLENDTPLLPRGEACVIYQGCMRRSMDKEFYERFLSVNGWKISQKPNNSDLVIYDTCGVTNERSREVIADLELLYGSLKSNCRVIVCGCLTKTNPKMLSDVFAGDTFGPREQHLLNKLLEASFPIEGIEFPYLTRGENIRFNPQLDFFENFLNGCIRLASGQGCLNNCSFCAIRFATGSLKSSPADLIIRQLKEGLSQNVKKVCLIGEDVAAWGQDLDKNISNLLEELMLIDDDFDLGLFDMNPRWMIKYWETLRKELLDSRIKEILIPFQSGSEEVLKNMKRHHSAKDLERILEDLRKLRPDIKMGAVIIAGFPGETDAQARETSKLLSYFDYAQANGFSPVPGTSAAKLTEHNKISKDEIIRRCGYFLDIMPNTRVFV